jgi:hypothetical protein
MALADFLGDEAGLLIACKRILDRQPTSAPLVWLAGHVLGAPNPRQALWDAVDALEADQTAAALAYTLPDDAVVATIGWDDRVATISRKRGDIGFVIVDVDGSADYQIDRVIESGQRATTVDAEATAQALFEASVLIVRFEALGTEHGLAPLGSFPAAAVARHLGLPVWGVAGIGVALADRMYDGLTRRWHERSSEPLTERELEEIPTALVDQVITTAGPVSVDQAVHNGGCPIVPELF